MIWVLLFAVIFGSSSNNEFILPSFQKAVKEYVIEKENQKEIVLLINKSKESRKPLLKKSQQDKKALDKIFKNRSTTSEQFDSLFSIAIQNKTDLRAINLSTLAETQQYISEEEWKKIVPKFQEDVEKYVENSKKIVKAANKYFDKIEKVIIKNITDPSQQDKALTNIQHFESTLINGYEKLVFIASNENSLINKYPITKQDIEETDKEISLIIKEAYDEYAKLHSSIVFLTTEEEWKKINSDLVFTH